MRNDTGRRRIPGYLRASAGSEYSVPRCPDAVSNGLRREAKGWRAAMDDGEAMGILLTWDDGRVSALILDKPRAHAIAPGIPTKQKTR
ncbi:hypothetical protein SDC9_204899 [bioreactor metagenome]|uniref:Uncharacterized protein n=1 Tax=bioreactor metagenome TaxID=1076179 RepID=A0A645J0I3_9ZZZZ